MDNSSFGSLAVLPFTDKLNTRGLARGPINKDRKDERVIEKTWGPVSAAGTAPHKSSVRGRGAYDPSAPRGHGAVAGISPFCECLNVCCCFCCVLFLFFVFRYTMLWRPALPALSADCGHTSLCT